MKKCKRVKNPCKICQQTVTNKTGIQCKGACKKWAHFCCLGFTPEKIQDIKAGVINITCPCPTCNASESKELMTPPYNSTGCPKDEQPKGQNTKYTKTNPNPIPDYTRNIPQTTKPACGPRRDYVKETTPQTCKPFPKCFNPSVTLRNPGHSAFKSAGTDKCNDASIQPLPQAAVQTSCKSTKNHSEAPTKSCNSKQGGRIGQELDENCKVTKREDMDGISCVKKTKDCNVNTKLSTEKVDCACREDKFEGSDMKRMKIKCLCKPVKKETSPVLEDHENCCSCNKKRTSSPRSSQSCLSCTNVSDCLPAVQRKMKSHECKSVSDSALSLSRDSHKALLCTIHQLCSNVGYLSNQIKELMYKMLVGDESS